MKTRLSHLSEQVQDELRREIGSRQVQVRDRTKLPFTNAVIHETQRVANITPISLPHVTYQDVTFQGHFIKKVRRFAFADNMRGLMLVQWSAVFMSVDEDYDYSKD